MKKSTTKPFLVPSRSDLRAAVHQKVVEVVEALLIEELSGVLGTDRYERCDERRGYRHGSEERRVTTEYGPMEMSVPRGRVRAPDGTTTEYQSAVLPRYARRTERVDEAILGCYLAGANSRRIKKALAPLLGEANLSKSAISRVVGRIKKMFEEWDRRELSEERYAVVYLDALNLKVRLAKRVISVPVLAVLGVEPDGQKRLVALRLVMSESEATWRGLMEDLRRRGLGAPAVIVSDGHAGLVKAMEAWPESEVQRCTVHKLRNLLTHCPCHSHGELRRDYHKIVRASDGLKAREAYDRFLSKWSALCPAVAKSLAEAGLKLLTFYRFPKPMWKSLRSTNALENLNREFRRRTKTQASFSTEQAAVTLLFGLVAFGQITLRKIDGYRQVSECWSDEQKEVA
jgi:transposase-like protein